MNALERTARKPLIWMRQLYDWTLHWGKTPYAVTALAIMSFAESSFFPVPPDVLLIAMCVSAHTRWVKYATVTSVGSVLGGIAGYAIGYFAFDTLGEPLMNLVASISGQETQVLIDTAHYWFNEKQVAGFHVGGWAVGLAGFTPIPYKVFTISAGFFKMDFAVFTLASVISRPLRFFLVAGIIGLLYRRYGDRITVFIDKYFNLLGIAFVVLLIGGIFVMRLLK